LRKTPEFILALLTPATGHKGLAGAGTSDRVTVPHRPIGIALTGSAGNTKQWVSIEPRYALITFKAHGIVEAVEALPSGGVTHWPQCRVHIAITTTCGAPTDLLWKCITGYQEAVFNMVK